jgi:hypothetical protein
MRNYTKKEIAHLLQVSPRTIADDANFLNLKPTVGDRGMNLYTQRDFNLIEQLRTHCKDKSLTRDSFVPKAQVEIVEPEARITKLNKPDKIDKFETSLAIAFEQDPLFDLELLQRISNNRWLLPSKRLAPLFGISAKQLNSRRQYCYCGFMATRETIESGKILWKITANNQ